jgi:hypothetical protein
MQFGAERTFSAATISSGHNQACHHSLIVTRTLDEKLLAARALECSIENNVRANVSLTLRLHREYFSQK